MQIVIDIPEEWFCRLQNEWGWALAENVREAIKNGQPLPKGHGRLIDADVVWSKLKEIEDTYQAQFLDKSNVLHEASMFGRLYGFTQSRFIVQDAPTIIEAEKEAENEGSN